LFGFINISTLLIFFPQQRKLTRKQERRNSQIPVLILGQSLIQIQRAGPLQMRVRRRNEQGRKKGKNARKILQKENRRRRRQKIRKIRKLKTG